ncbi:hypothetical protein [Glycomyces buryatensis]|uniref:Uncharacterized protein n=1 Tax=Glycomyces buryatensis TaxID=2570927 RepID=A0A4S8QNI3_9ACTN|nr:hypothetical protein [Glycomyces buryatensis]THV42999.1 hypothetical protein FAB82_03330 [Glycomyces buryatensis]
MGQIVCDTEFVEQLGPDIEREVAPILEEASDMLPELRSLDRGLYTAVTLPMAASYTMAVTTVTESMAGAAECFKEMNDAIAGCAADYRDIDGTVASALGGEG